MSQYLAQVLQDAGNLNTKSVPHANGGKGTYRPHVIPQSSRLFLDIQQAMQFTVKKHRGNKGGVFSRYKIEKIERIGNQSIMDRYNSYKKTMVRHVSNERMLFHGTSDPYKIICHGFDKSEANPQGMFGGGFYFTDVSSKANQYVGGGGPCANHRKTSCYTCERMLILCRVNLGKSLKLTRSQRFDTNPFGYHSVTGVPTLDGLKHKEYVVYKSQQVYPEFLITYKICL